MSREEFKKLIGPYLDGELSTEEREKVEEYLAGSEEYRLLASETEDLTRLARDDRPPDVSDDRWLEMLASIRSGEEEKVFSIESSRTRWLAPLAGIAAIIVAGFFILSAGPDSPEKPAPPSKDYADTGDAGDESPVRIDTIDTDDKKEELKPVDPRFEEE